MSTISCFPPTGSMVQVLISKVTQHPSCGLVELLVDEVGKTVGDQTRREVLRKFHESEGKAGDLCLVLINESWHWARVVSKQRQTFTLFLIDQGQTHVATLDAMAWGRDEGLRFPSKGQSCILANVLTVDIDGSQRATNFLNSLCGKTFKGLVQHVLIPDRMFVIDIPLISKSMCKFGVAKKIPEDEFKGLILKCLHLPKGDATDICLHEETLKDSILGNNEKYFCPDLLPGIFETVKVTEVIDPHNIYCQLVILSKAVKLFSDEVHQHYENNVDNVEFKARRSGSPCASRGADGRWQRATLKENIEDKSNAVEVFFVDEGKTERVITKRIRPLHGKFMKMPVFTYHCSLDGVTDDGKGWTQDRTDYLRVLILNRTFVARLEKYNSIQDDYSISLYAENAVCINNAYSEIIGHFQKGQPFPLPHLVSICDELYSQQQSSVTVSQVKGLLSQTIRNETNITEDVVSRTNCVSAEGISVLPGTDLPFSHRPSEIPYNESFNEGSELDVEVSCVEGLHRFWCQMTKNADSLKQLMSELQDFYALPHPRPIVESVCVARNPENNKWYRAKIMTNDHNPAVEVRFIDYGGTQRVSVQDIRPLDPAFLRLDAQAFQCCLLPTKNDASSVGLSHFQKFLDTAEARKERLTCVIKAKRCDEEGLSLNVVEIRTPSESSFELLNLEYSEAVANVSPEKYLMSAHNIKVGVQENVLLTCIESVNHFYCQLDRNSNSLEKVKQTIKKVVNQPQESGVQLDLDGVCLARYSDGVWYRGQVVEMSPKLKVHLVDYGDTIAVTKSDLRFPNAGVCNSVPVLAVLVGLFGVPDSAPQEINRWFAKLGIGQNFTISMVAKDSSGKIMIELFEDSMNINERIREGIEKVNGSRTTHRADKHLSKSSTPCKEDQSNKGDQRKVPSAVDESEICSPTLIEDTAENDFEDEPDKSFAIIQTKSAYMNPKVRREQIEGIIASHIVGPNYFWCQLIHEENLDFILSLMQGCGPTEDFIVPENLHPGSPCPALYRNDNKWYRAQVNGQTADKVHVILIDSGQESKVAIHNLKMLPKKWLLIPPLSFLCTLNGFDETKGFWNEDASDDFNNLLMGRRLKVSVCDVKEHVQKALPQYAVEIECEGLDINSHMHTHWSTVAKKLLPESCNSEESLQDSHTESTNSQENVVKENVLWQKNPVLDENKTQTAFASCIVEPKFFWCQLENTEILTKISALAQEAGTAAHEAMNPDNLLPGGPCLARFPCDDQWYRAQVFSKTDDKVHVIFIDYGNESDVDIRNVMSLPKHLMELSPAAFLCSLNGFDEAKGFWSDEAHDQFYSLLNDKSLSLKVHSVRENPEMALPQYSVELSSEGLDVVAEMNKYWNPEITEQAVPEADSKETPTVNNSMYKEPTMSETAYASCIAEPKFFWCQSDVADLTNISTLSQGAGCIGQTVKNPESLKCGSPCLALFNSDNQWHRAQVVNSVENKVQVVFIDHGNESEMDLKDLRLMPTGLLDLPPLAFLCSLRGFDETRGSWTECAIDVFYNLLVDKLLKVSVHKMEVNLEVALPQYQVDIECEGEVVNKVMQKYWIQNSGTS